MINLAKWVQRSLQKSDSSPLSPPRAHGWNYTQYFKTFFVIFRCFCSDIIIYTLVVIDLKKCNLILNNALEISSIKEAKSNIVQDFASYASKSSLDTFFMILFVALGNLSDSKEIKNFSLFSCLLLTSNFLIFITVYPALLSLILQVNE